jgi:hypothetical protein
VAGPGDGFVVFAAGFHASVQDAGEAAGDAAQRVLVADFPGSQSVVVAAGTGRGRYRGGRLDMEGVNEVPAADVAACTVFFLPDWMVSGEVPA